MGKIISLETKITIKNLLPFHSISEIAKITGLCQRTIFNIQQQWNIERTSEQIKNIRSNSRKKLIQDEKRRVLFGKEQKTNIKVVSNKQRLSLKYRLKRKGYLPGLLPNTFTYNNETKRVPEYEKTGKTLGLTITPA